MGEVDRADGQSVKDPVPVAAREAGEGAAQRPDGAYCGRNGGNAQDDQHGGSFLRTIVRNWGIKKQEISMAHHRVSEAGSFLAVPERCVKTPRL